MDFRKAMELIVANCDNRPGCNECPMHHAGNVLGGYYCMLQYPCPDEWDVDRICKAAEEIASAVMGTEEQQNER